MPPLAIFTHCLFDLSKIQVDIQIRKVFSKLNLIITRLFWQTHLAGNNKLLKLHNGSPYALARRNIFKASGEKPKCSGHNMAHLIEIG